MYERTLVLIKPDAVEECVVGEILTYFENVDLKITNMRWMSQAPLDTLAMHYIEHEGQPFLPNQLLFMRSGPVIAVVLAGEDAVSQARSLLGDKDPQKAAEGTIRYELAWRRYLADLPRNLVHASDSPESAERELGLWFPA